MNVKLLDWVEENATAFFDLGGGIVGFSDGAFFFVTEKEDSDHGFSDIQCEMINEISSSMADQIWPTDMIQSDYLKPEKWRQFKDSHGEYHLINEDYFSLIPSGAKFHTCIGNNSIVIVVDGYYWGTVMPRRNRRYD